GPWMALRAAILVPFALSAPRPADGFDPCPTCVERPCIQACPVGAVGPGGWDVPRCAEHRIADPEDCGSGCHSRIAGVYGREHRYPPDALAFRQLGAGVVQRRARAPEQPSGSGRAAASREPLAATTAEVGCCTSQPTSARSVTRRTRPMESWGCARAARAGRSIAPAGS